ncbi:MAG: subtype I-C CRISPR-associated endonuclease Cas1 [Deltaproteobacteria bacterium CG12_big_fil_rev_8_21_14_0_65_43_10]|nr:MAG: subtype I-C CRISPR-associated endonuclease Cas1 [Deltaproteobacteria bacterium CG2_30_43_15]PIQ45346.1 MAG: subtype I-C CRISPR-associated endonuclease Cas1 [Deltaproteobacteria bacterium CG12_big_fil_rev_8_21_14_0_65_43_10]PIU86456.1 MAG: subtype I-C CRISPR-associated endonuclease Cas1 [Deltaproteobacteria bacterium CG06_land_8_20_14_3_00_44_19]PIX25754.1 MAG: subtype I-C CRISPR-associated endonuclease Cas1 [Deltaproteobacteria bacterium CG_4_8_14_3_um_filter_43_13]PIZ19954.1 MAG: subty
MKRHLNTLFVTTQGAYLSKEGETVVVKVEKEIKLRIPVHTIGGIVCFGNVSCSPFLMGFCAENSVGISFLSEYGRFLARVQGPVSGNVLLRREQYRRADDLKASAEVARALLTGKLANCRTVLQRALRDHSDKIDTEAISRASQRLSKTLTRIKSEDNLDVLRGMEGDMAHIYFSVFNHLITAQKEDFVFEERNRRPPLDNVNCLLSFLYTMVMHDVRSALETVGLDPAVGFLHRDRPGRPGLALDMMEELRPFIADRLTLSLINLKQVQKKGFKKADTGAVTMSDETRKEVLVSYQNRKQEEIMHPFIEEKITIGLLFHIQAMLFARYLRGDMDGYPPFIWK